MIRLYTFLIFSFLVKPIFCQTPVAEQETQHTEAGHLGFFIGAALPAGSFGSKNFSDSTSGFAKTGLIAGLTASYRLNDMLNLTGMFADFANNVNGESIAKQAAAKYKGYTWAVNSDNWSVKSFLGGFSLKQPLPGAELQLSGLIGVAISSSPELFLTGSGNGRSNTAKISSTTTNALCLAGTMTFKKDLGPSFYFMLNGGFLHTRPQFTGVTTSFTSGSATVSSFYQQISIFAFSAGFGYRFTRTN